MQFTRPSRLIALPAAVAFGLALFVASLTWQVPAARAGSGPLDAQSNEIVRLINGARAASGKSALNVDTFLASKARDGAIPCPDNAAESISGRTQDFAAYDAMDHKLRLCDAPSYTLSTTSYVTVLQGWGYGSVGEINLVNGGYGSGAFLYSVGGWQSWTYSTTGHAMLGWQSSSSHWNIILGGYDRVGCGGWASGSTYYYECSFSSGGPNGVESPPTASPFDLPLPTPPPTPVPTPEPTPAPTRHVAPPANGGGGGSGGGSGSAGATTSAGATSSAGATISDPLSGLTVSVPAAPAIPSASATSVVLGLQAYAASATPGAGPAAAAQLGGDGIGPGGGFSELPSYIARIVALAAGSGAAVLWGCSAFLTLRRRRHGREIAG